MCSSGWFCHQNWNSSLFQLAIHTSSSNDKCWQLQMLLSPKLDYWLNSPHLRLQPLHWEKVSQIKLDHSICLAWKLGPFLNLPACECDQWLLTLGILIWCLIMSNLKFFKFIAIVLETYFLIEIKQMKILSYLFKDF